MSFYCFLLSLYFQSVLSKLPQNEFPFSSLLALEDKVTSLLIHPNSHRAMYEYYRPHKNAKNRRHPCVQERVQINLHKGECLIFNALLLHCGPAYKLPMTRLHCYFVYEKVEEALKNRQGKMLSFPVDLYNSSGKFFVKNLPVSGNNYNSYITNTCIIFTVYI